MSLQVEVLASGDQESVSPAPVPMTSDSLSIGRSDKNDITLPDPTRVVSNRHLCIEKVDGEYMLIDTSTNGVRLNGEAIEKGIGIPLEDGDELQVGHYRLRIELSSAVTPPPQNPLDVFGSAGDGIADPSERGLEDMTSDPLAMLGQPGTTEQEPPASSDPLAMLGQPGPTAQEPPAPADPFVFSEPDHGSEIAQHMPMPRVQEDPSAPPAPVEPQEDIPEALRGLMAAGAPAPAAQPAEPPAPPAGGDPFGALPPGSTDSNPAVAPPAPAPGSFTTAQTPTATPPPAVTAQPAMTPPRAAAPQPAAMPQYSGAPGAHGDLAPLLEGLGLRPDTPLNAQQLFELGRVVALLLESFIGALAVRSRFKAEFGVARTMIQSTKNNPIKLSQSAAEALERLFVTPRPGYLPALEAAEDAVSDLATHELAMFSALKATNRAMLEQLDPDRLAADFQRQAPARLGIGVLSKSAYWDQYRSFFEGTLQDADPVLHFFAEGYDQAVKELEKGQSGES
ncbi:MAG: type VI secretion system-associated FHA domain protein TagH [Pseudomonadota bacterium]